MSSKHIRPVKPELPALSIRPNSNRPPRGFNAKENANFRSVSFPHLSSPPSPAASCSSLKPSPLIYSTPRKHRHSSSLSYKPLTPAASVSSFQTCPEPGSPFIIAAPTPLLPRTPSRYIASPPPSPSPRLPFPPRARATLAMSVQVHSAILDSPSNYHQPSPRSPSQNLLDMYPGPSSSNPRRKSFTSRPVSPMVNRPSSRSEKLLRDTLRRADEHDRTQERSPFFLSSAMTIRRDDESSDCEDDAEGMLWRSTSGSSGESAEFNPLPTRASLVRNKSVDHKHRNPMGSPTSSRMSLQRSPNSAPIMILREEDEMTPHDAVLRTRLEGVLHQAADQKRRRSARSISRVRAHTRDSSEDWTSESWSPPPMYSQQLPSSSPRGSLDPITPPPTPPHTAHSLYASPSYPSQGPVPSFNARTASAMCRQIDGYVSFANVEGLGAPPEVDDQDEDSGRRQKWLKWLGIKSATMNAPEYSARA